MTIAQLLGEACQKIDQFDAEFLLADVLHASRAHLYEYPDHVVYKKDVRQFQRYVLQRAKGVPILYIVGYAIFCRLAIGVTKDVMIPRSTSEKIAELALKKIQKSSASRTTIIDVGTGSGCIPIAIAKNLSADKKNVHFFATEISKKALKVAEENANFHEVDIHFLRGDLLSPILEKRLIPSRTHLVITAHLPYIPTTKTKGRTEPKISLDGGEDGLALYRQLFFQIQGLRGIPGLALDVFCECAPEQMKKMQEYIQESLPKSKIKIYKDKIGKERVIHIRAHNENIA